jgi:PKD repeat protein
VGLSTFWTNKTPYIAGTAVVAPVASFNGTPSMGANPLTEFFVDVSSNSPTSWNWSFGDGTVSALQNPTHTYTKSGFFTINFTVSNTAGSSWANKSNFVTVY